MSMIYKKMGLSKDVDQLLTAQGGGGFNQIHSRFKLGH